MEAKHLPCPGEYLERLPLLKRLRFFEPYLVEFDSRTRASSTDGNDPFGKVTIRLSVCASDKEGYIIYLHNIFQVYLIRIPRPITWDPGIHFSV